MGNVIKTAHKVDQPKQPSKVDTTRSAGGFGQTILSSGANLAFGTIGSIIGAEISDRYNKKAEERMDKRNRQLILDTPTLTTQGRRRAGLNPYGEPILPGMSSQSSTDTSDVAPGAFYNAQQLTLQERIAMRQLENETTVAQSQANRNNAEADRLRGQEGRDTEKFMDELLGVRLSNQLKQVQIDTEEFLLNFNKEKAPIELENLRKMGEKIFAETQELISQDLLNEEQIKIAQQEISKLVAQTMLINMQINLTESNIKLNTATINKWTHEIQLSFDKFNWQQTTDFYDMYLDYLQYILEDAKLDEEISWHNIQAVFMDHEQYINSYRAETEEKRVAGEIALGVVNAIITGGIASSFAKGKKITISPVKTKTTKATNGN